ncbi:SRPBCC domain-containing protein [Mycobacteroides franklinii]|uniref:SRPBCC domain-containing protein n=1 Tax=Mycobacteroides franklinii TaxID=948102 RepID=UPI0013E8D0EF|nr:hypothetical protein [Mycobacteroides franklinii]
MKGPRAPTDLHPTHIEDSPCATYLRINRIFDCTATTLWASLTTPPTMARWWYRTTGFTTTPGTRFHIEAPPVLVETHFCRRWNCVIDTVSEPEHVSIAISTTDHNWLICFGLKPVNAGTELTAVHAGFDEARKSHRMARYIFKGIWTSQLDDLENLLSIKTLK